MCKTTKDSIGVTLPVLEGIIDVHSGYLIEAPEITRPDVSQVAITSKVAKMPLSGQFSWTKLA